MSDRRRRSLSKEERDGRDAQDGVQGTLICTRTVGSDVPF
jgi:hypothetical protein